jgi:hypothetical protein
MVGMTTRKTFRAITVAGLAVAVAAALTGCTHASTTTPSASASSSAGTAPRTSSPSASASAAPIGERVDVPCETLVPAAAFAVYGRTFTLVPDAKPGSGTPAATIAAQRGQVCVWKDPDGVTVTVAVAKLPASALTRLKDSLYQNSHSVPTYTVEGYFDVAKGLGRADAFPDPYWVSAESTMFGEPGDAQPLLDAVRATLAPSETPSGTTATPSGAPTS